VPGKISVGHKCFVEAECWFDSNINIGNFVMLVTRVAIVGGDHRIDIPGVPAIEAGRDKNKPVTIHDNVYVEYGVIIGHGVTIGEGRDEQILRDIL